MPITRRFTVYTNAGVSVPPVIHVNQYDRGETWIFTLLEPNGSQYIPASGGIVGIKADGHAIINTATVNSNGEVVVSETQQMTAAPGKAVYEIIFDNSTHGTANFIVCVEPKPGDNATLSDSDLSLIQEAIDSTIPANIEASVQDWMDDNLAPAEWVIDNTLSIAGAAADAKKVGDVTSELKTAINTYLIDKEVLDFAWESGGISQGSGYGYNTYKRIRTTSVVPIKQGAIFEIASGYQYKIHFYSNTSTSSYTGDTGFLTGQYVVSEDTYVKFDIARRDGETITITDGDDVLEVYYPSNKALNALQDAFSTSFTPSLAWEYGTLETDGSTGRNNRRCRTATFTEITEPTEITLTPSSTKLAVFFYGNNFTHISNTGWITSNASPAIPQGTKYIKFLGGYSNDAVLTDNDITAISAQFALTLYRTYDISDIYKNNLFTVMTYNPQMFTLLNANETMQEIIIEKYKPDIIGLQEYREVINRDANRSVYTNIFSEYPNHYRYTGIPNSVGIVSKNKLFNTTGAKFTFQSADDPDASLYKEDRGYIKTYIYQNGKKICWINTHLDLNPSTRYVQLAEIRSMMALEEYCIVTGDFNTTYMTSFSSTEWINAIKPFIDDGYNVTNNGEEIGINWTFSGSTDAQSDRQALDTVITTANIRCLGIIFDKTKLEYLDGVNLLDHIPVIVKLAID